MASLYQRPNRVEYSKPYSDDSGDRIKIIYSSRETDIKIETVDYININKEDLEWLIDVLQDIKRLHSETIEK